MLAWFLSRRFWCWAPYLAFCFSVLVSVQPCPRITRESNYIQRIISRFLHMCTAVTWSKSSSLRDTMWNNLIKLLRDWKTDLCGDGPEQCVSSTMKAPFGEFWLPRGIWYWMRPMSKVCSCYDTLHEHERPFVGGIVDMRKTRKHTRTVHIYVASERGPLTLMCSHVFIHWNSLSYTSHDVAHENICCDGRMTPGLSHRQ